MSLTRDTSRFYQYWLDHVDQDLADAKKQYIIKILNILEKLLKQMV